MTLATALPVAGGVSVSTISGEVTRGDPIFPREFLPHIALCFEFRIQGGFQKMEPTRDMRLDQCPNRCDVPEAEGELVSVQSQWLARCSPKPMVGWQ
jgi:hypothetical protein